MTREKDEDLIQFRNRVVGGILVGIAIMVPVLICFGIRVWQNNEKAMKKIQNKESFVLVLYNDNFIKEVKSFEKALAEKDISYLSYNVSKEEDYEALISRLELYDNLSYPTFIYINGGKASLLKEEVNNFSLMNEFLDDIELVE